MLPKRPLAASMAPSQTWASISPSPSTTYTPAGEAAPQGAVWAEGLVRGRAGRVPYRSPRRPRARAARAGILMPGALRSGCPPCGSSAARTAGRTRDAPVPSRGRRRRAPWRTAAGRSPASRDARDRCAGDGSKARPGSRRRRTRDWGRMREHFALFDRLGLYDATHVPTVPEHRRNEQDAGRIDPSYGSSCVLGATPGHR